jgi:signal transduction histidine kinase
VALDEVEHAHGRMRSLIEDLLELARSGEVVADAVGVDLGATARDAWSTLDTTDGEIDVVDTMQVTADRDRLRDVLVNLFRNGMEHNDTRDTPVAIEVGSLDDAAGFYVADDGEGIPPAEREAVFETGYTNAEDGTGFGLAIVSEVTQAHGWSVSITDADGGGARFEFRGVETPH